MGTNAAPKIWLPQSKGKVDMSEKDHGHPVHGMGWFEPYSNRREQEVAAVQNLAFIRSRADELYNRRMLKESKWTNDPLVFPLEEHETPATQVRGMEGIVPFPPNDQQYYICGIYDREKSFLTDSAKPGHDMYTEGQDELNSAWVRLSDFNQHDGAVDLFKEKGQKGYHYGRVMQGALDNGYFVEALNAVSLRPRLVRHLFHGYDNSKAIYIVRLYKHGMWHRMELDDYVPVSPPPDAHHKNHGPICCTSEHFPHVLWPSLAEKAYAKLFTKRLQTVGDDPHDLGGWEAIGAGGRVEDALVLLTGGVAGRFRTREVSADRLFVYLFERQTDTLFVCRVNQPSCELFGVKLNPYYPYAVNRAVPWEGRLYVQVFCAAPTCYDGGLEDVSVPYSLTHCAEYPEHQDEGFFWCDVNDFHLYFDTIIECHLTNTPPCAIPGMPPPRLPLWMPPPVVAQPGAPPGVPPGAPPGVRPGTPPGTKPGGQQAANAFPERVRQFVEGEALPYFENVHANPGVITKHNTPEFNIEIAGIDQGNHLGCTEVVCSLDQYDERIMMDSPLCRRPAEVLLKAYVRVNETVVANGEKDLWQLVCKSNWLPINHSMLAFTCRRGCKIKIVAELPDGEPQHFEKAIFRCYCSQPNFTVAAMVAKGRHALGELPPGEVAAAVKWSLVGSIDPELMENPDKPMEFDPETDGLRKASQDVNQSWNELKQDCSIM